MGRMSGDMQSGSSVGMSLVYAMRHIRLNSRAPATQRFIGELINSQRASRIMSTIIIRLYEATRVAPELFHGIYNATAIEHDAG